MSGAHRAGRRNSPTDDRTGKSTVAVLDRPAVVTAPTRPVSGPTPLRPAVLPIARPSWPSGLLLLPPAVAAAILGLLTSSRETRLLPLVAVGGLCIALLPRRTLLLGALVPIYGVGTLLRPAIFADLRGLLTVLVLAQGLVVLPELIRRTNQWWWVLAAGFGICAVANADRGAVSAALLTVGTVLAAISIVHFRHLDDLFAGYRIGVALSAGAAVLALLKIVDVLPPVLQRQGTWGLSYRSTSFSFELAVGIVIWFFARPKTGLRWRWSIEGLLLLVALAVSGGRGGFVAVVVALAVHLVSSRAARRALLVPVVAAVVIFGLADAGYAPLTVQRLFGVQQDTAVAVSSSYSSGRTELFRGSLEYIRQEPLFGRGQGTTISVSAGSPDQAREPHNAFLKIWVDDGLLAAAAAAALLLTAAVAVFRLRRKSTQAALVAALLTVFLVRSVVESNGVLTGAGGVLLFAALLARAHEESATPAAAQPLRSAR